MNQMPQHKGTFSKVSFAKSLKGFLFFFHGGSYLLKESVYVFSDVSYTYEDNDVTRFCDLG